MLEKKVYIKNIQGQGVCYLITKYFVMSYQSEKVKKINAGVYHKASMSVHCWSKQNGFLQKKLKVKLLFIFLFFMYFQKWQNYFPVREKSRHLNTFLSFSKLMIFFILFTCLSVIYQRREKFTISSHMQVLSAIAFKTLQTFKALLFINGKANEINSAF